MYAMTHRIGSKRVRLSSGRLAVLAALAALSTSTYAADIYWDGSDGNSWNTVTNWSTDIAGGVDPGAVPGSADNVIFNANTVTTQIGVLGADQAANSLTFAANSTTAITIATGNTLNLYSGNITSQAGAAAHAINAPISLGDPGVGAGTFTAMFTNASSSTLSLGGAISKANAGTTWDLLVDGGGRVNFSGGTAQTTPFAATTVQNGSRLRVTGSLTGTYSFGAAGSTITLNNGTFEIGNTSSTNPLNVANTWNIGSGGGRIETFRPANPNESWNFSGATTLGGDLYLKVGYGGSTHSTWSGAVTVTGGDRTFTIDTAPNAALGTFSGAIGQDTPGRQLTLKVGVSNTTSAQAVTTFSGDNTVDHIVVETSGLTRTSAIRFGNLASLSDTSLKIASGAFAGLGFSNPADFATALGRITADSTGVLGVDIGMSNNIDLSAATGINRDLRIGSSATATYSGTLTPFGSSYKVGGGGGTITFSNANAFTGARNLDVATQGNLPGGTVAITNTNDFTGNIGVGASMTLQISSDAALGNAANAIALSGTLAAGGAVATSRAISATSGAGLAATSGNTLTINTAPGNLSLAPGGTLNITGAGAVVINTSLNDTVAGAMTVTGPTLRLGGTNSPYTKTITLSGGTVTLLSPSAQIAGNINGSSGAANKILLNGAGGPFTYTFGVGNGNGEASTPATSFPTSGGQGVAAYDGDVTWDPGNGGSYTLGTAATLKDRINFGYRVTSPSNDYSRILFGNNIGDLVLNGDLTLRSRGGAASTNQVVMSFALSDDGSARNLIIAGPHLVLTRPFAGTANSKLIVGSDTNADGSSVAISNVNQIPTGNLELRSGVLILDGVSWPTFGAARTAGVGANQWQFANGTGAHGFAARTSPLVIDTTGTSSTTFDASFTLGSIARDGTGAFYANQPVTVALNTTFSASRTISTEADGLTHTFSGQMTINAGTVTKAGGGTLSVSGKVTGAGAFASSAGTTELINAANDYLGGTTVSGGTLNVNVAGVLSNGGLTQGGGTVNMNAAGMTGGTLSINGGTFNLNTASVGNTATNIGGGTIVGVGEPMTLGGSGTIGGSFILGTTASTALTLSGNFEVNGGARRTITVPTTGPGLAGTSGTVHTLTGSLSPVNGPSVLQFAATGTSSDTASGEVVLAGTNTLNGSIWTNSNNNMRINTGPAGIGIVQSDVMVRFASPSALPSGNGGADAWIVAAGRNKAGGRYGYLLTGSPGGQTYELGAGYKFVLGGQLNAVLGSTGGNTTFENSSVAIWDGNSTTGSLGVNILVRDGVFTLGSPGKPVTFQGVGTTNVLTTDGGLGAAATPLLDSTGSRFMDKRGPGEVVLSNIQYKKVDGTTDATAAFAWRLFEGTLTQTAAGQLRNGVGSFDFDDWFNNGTTTAKTLNITAEELFSTTLAGQFQNNTELRVAGGVTFTTTQTAEELSPVANDAVLRKTGTGTWVYTGPADVNDDGNDGYLQIEQGIVDATGNMGDTRIRLAGGTYLSGASSSFAGDTGSSSNNENLFEITSVGGKLGIAAAVTTGDVHRGSTIAWDQGTTNAVTMASRAEANLVFANADFPDIAAPTTLTIARDGVGGGVVQINDAAVDVAGTLVVTGGLKMAAAGTGDINVLSGGTLKGNGTVTGDVFVQSGGIVAPGTSVGTLTLGDLSLADGAILDFELGAPPTGDQILCAALVLNGVNTLNIADAGGLGNGTYTLIDYATLSGTPAFTVDGPGGFSFSIIDSGSSIDVMVASIGATDSTWQTNVEGNWSTPGNWSSGVPGGNGWIARFTGAGLSSVIVDGSARKLGELYLGGNNYTISGFGLNFNNTGGATPGTASINVTSGIQNIASTVGTTSASNLAIDVAGGASLSLNEVNNAAGKAISKSGAGTLTIGGMQTHGVGSTLAVSGGTVNLDSDAGTAALAGSAAVGNLALAVTGGQVKLGANQTLKSVSSTVAGGIDLQNFRVSLYSSDIVAAEAAVLGMLGAGQIIDSTSGFFTSAAIGVTNIDPDVHGDPYVLVRLTLRGDTTCDGLVNFRDLRTLSQNYNKAAGATWDEGDFDYNGNVNFRDLLKLSQNYSSAEPAGAAVPEPGVLGLLAIGAMGLLARRRR